MKKASLLIIYVLYSLSAMCQQKIILSDTVHIKLPNETETLNKDQFTESINNKFSNSKLALENIPNIHERTDNKHYYKVNNVLITLVHGKRPEKNKESYLSDLKRGKDNMFSVNRELVHYTSVIKIVNKNPVLITYEVVENIGYYRFNCNDSTNTYALNGTLQFNETDKDEATELLYKILNSIEFKK